MEVNTIIIIIIGIIVLLIVFYLIRQNKKDKKSFEKKMNEMEIPVEKHNQENDPEDFSK